MQTILCFSHLGWNFVYQRPQHLLSRFAVNDRVFYFEEPFISGRNGYTAETQEGIIIIRMFSEAENRFEKLKKVVNSVLKDHRISNYLCWYYTPMALEFTEHLSPELVIYDSMDELRNFRFAPENLPALEEELFRRSDIVFTGGHSLYNAKKHRHHNIHAFPSSIDREHFAAAKSRQPDPEDQKDIPHPRLGFFGVVDERFDTELLGEVAAKRPGWQFIIIGPVVKIDEKDLPRAENIHYLGRKTYYELPTYISNWDIALIPFALNEATEFISPTKTPEYLAAGLPVISTAIKDVVNPYGEEQLVHIIRNSEEFIAYAETELAKESRKDWSTKVEKFLENNSWDQTYSRMNALINNLKTN